uniref:Afadin-and alpha-actinin-binding protein n=1 Tax=Macrostomum lignano TaxID=282301 RepID=A0A1I8GSV8_9PLAT
MSTTRRYSLSSAATSPLAGYADPFELGPMQHHQHPYLHQQQQLRLSLRRGPDSSLRHLDQELSVLGLPGLFLTASADELNVSALASACQQLVALYHRSRDAREALEDKNRRLESELRDSRRAEQRLQETARDAASQSAGLRERERRLDERGRRLNDQLREARDEAKRLNQQLQQRDTQHRHERRKLSKEADRLRERLQAGLSNSLGPVRLSCIESAPPTPLRLTSADQAQIPKFQRNYQAQLESRQAELAAENQELRDSLFRVHRQLRELQLLSLASAEQDENAEADANGDPADEEELHENLLKLPYQLLKDRLDRQLKAGCDRLRTRLGQPGARGRSADGGGGPAAVAGAGSSASNGEDSVMMQEQMRQLKERLSSYEELMHRQEQLIKQSFLAHFLLSKNRSMASLASRTLPYSTTVTGAPRIIRDRLSGGAKSSLLKARYRQRTGMPLAMAMPISMPTPCDSRLTSATT